MQIDSQKKLLIQNKFVYNQIIMNKFMNYNVEQIKKISLGLFIALGSTHLFSTLLIINNTWLKFADISGKIIAIPFAISGLVYGLSSLRLSLSQKDKNHKILDIFLASITAIVFIALLVITLVFPNL